MGLGHRLRESGGRLASPFTDIPRGTHSRAERVAPHPRRRQSRIYINTPAERAAAVAWETEGINGAAAAFQAGVPSARVVQIPQTNHYVFLSNETDVLREMRAFLKGLP